MSLKVTGLSSALLRSASFEVADREILVLRGPSGSGKTLLLRAIADLDLNEGEVEVDGLLRSGTPGPRWRRLVRYVAAEPAWWADRVGDHFREPRTTGIRANRLGLPDGCMDWPVMRLSTGQKQRLGFLRATEDCPRVLLLDEPTSSLDSDSESAVETMMRELLDEGVSILAVTHSTEQAARLGGRCMRMEDGRLLEGEA
jgi:ABC-type iron transport system FetAB ATPase subunit